MHAGGQTVGDLLYPWLTDDVRSVTPDMTLCKGNAWFMVHPTSTVNTQGKQQTGQTNDLDQIKNSSFVFTTNTS
jgi:hypothetical protein